MTPEERRDAVRLSLVELDLAEDLASVVLIVNRTMLDLLLRMFGRSLDAVLAGPPYRVRLDRRQMLVIRNQAQESYRLDRPDEMFASLWLAIAPALSLAEAEL